MLSFFEYFVLVLWGGALVVAVLSEEPMQN